MKKAWDTLVATAGSLLPPPSTSLKKIKKGRW
jgi:hypothetical protein